MKKILFGLMAITLMSTTALYAEKGKTEKKRKAQQTCNKSCEKKKDCPTVCPPIPDCCK